MLRNTCRLLMTYCSGPTVFLPEQSIRLATSVDLKWCVQGKGPFSLEKKSRTRTSQSPNSDTEIENKSCS